MLRRNSASICPYGDFNQRAGFIIICRLDSINFSTKMQVFAFFLFYEKIDANSRILSP
jgi:hypothetical protein